MKVTILVNWRIMAIVGAEVRVRIWLDIDGEILRATNACHIRLQRGILTTATSICANSLCVYSLRMSKDLSLIQDFALLQTHSVLLIFAKKFLGLYQFPGPGRSVRGVFHIFIDQNERSFVVV